MAATTANGGDLEMDDAIDLAKERHLESDSEYDGSIRVRDRIRKSAHSLTQNDSEGGNRDGTLKNNDKKKKRGSKGSHRRMRSSSGGLKQAITDKDPHLRELEIAVAMNDINGSMEVVTPSEKEDTATASPTSTTTTPRKGSNLLKKLGKKKDSASKKKSKSRSMSHDVVLSELAEGKSRKFNSSMDSLALSPRNPQQQQQQSGLSRRGTTNTTYSSSSDGSDESLPTSPRSMIVGAPLRRHGRSRSGIGAQATLNTDKKDKKSSMTLKQKKKKKRKSGKLDTSDSTNGASGSGSRIKALKLRKDNDGATTESPKRKRTRSGGVGLVDDTAVQTQLTSPRTSGVAFDGDINNTDNTNGTTPPAKEDKKKKKKKRSSGTSATISSTKSKKKKEKKRGGSMIVGASTPVERSSSKTSSGQAKKQRRSKSRIDGQVILESENESTYGGYASASDPRKIVERRDAKSPMSPRNAPLKSPRGAKDTTKRASRDKGKERSATTAPRPSEPMLASSDPSNTPASAAATTTSSTSPDSSPASQFRAAPGKSRSFVMLSTVSRPSRPGSGIGCQAAAVIVVPKGSNRGSARGSVGGGANPKSAIVTGTRRPSVTGESMDEIERFVPYSSVLDPSNNSNYNSDSDDFTGGVGGRCETGEASNSRVRVRIPGAGSTGETESDNNSNSNNTTPKKQSVSSAWKSRLQGSLSGRTGAHVRNVSSSRTSSSPTPSVNGEDDSGTPNTRTRAFSVAAGSSSPGTSPKGGSISMPDLESIFSPRVEASPPKKKLNYAEISPKPRSHTVAARSPRTAKELNLKAVTKRGTLRQVETTIITLSDASLQYGRYAQTALHFACSRKEPDLLIVKHLITLGADVQVKDYRGWTPLHSLCRTSGDTAILQHLVTNGANVNAVTKAGDTPLHFFAGERRVTERKKDVIEACKQTLTTLLQLGAWLEGNNHDAETPLLLAIRKGNAAQADLLVEQGADMYAVTRRGKTALHLAVEADSPELASLLVVRCGVNDKQPGSSTRSTRGKGTSSTSNSSEGLYIHHDYGCGSAWNAALASTLPHAQAVQAVIRTKGKGNDGSPSTTTTTTTTTNTHTATTTNHSNNNNNNIHTATARTTNTSTADADEAEYIASLRGRERKGTIDSIVDNIFSAYDLPMSPSDASSRFSPSSGEA
eukprot:TRINITY_DN850_c1_g2_i1.p1 TRINITY_DN850_c1_g2~~TRINITY_DN850_c1_g2_i1.p1  ORF type:complete len:1219 (+),score=304.85 TRINITY_DN850_c1_g2_i1:157-3657(+)